jgi:hypothetical protein
MTSCRHFRRSMTLGSVLLVACFIVPIAAHSQTKTQAVTVVNPTTSPVNSRITNTVVPVEVRNANPVSVDTRETLHPVRVSWHDFQHTTGECNETGYIVPAGKILVVEHVMVSGPQRDVAFVGISASGLLMALAPPSAVYPADGTMYISQPVTFYAFEGHSFNIHIFRPGTVPPLPYSCVFMGRLVDATP